MEQEYTIDNSYLSPEAQKRKKDLEENPYQPYGIYGRHGSAGF